jgi:hypothetical protein
VAVLFCWFAVVLLLVCAVLFFTRLRKLGCWLLVIFPAALCAALLRDLAKGAQKLGEASYQSDLKTLLPLVGFLAITLFAALRPRWGWVFWIAWILNALVCALVVFLTYFWKVFS